MPLSHRIVAALPRITNFWIPTTRLAVMRSYRTSLCLQRSGGFRRDEAPVVRDALNPAPETNDDRTADDRIDTLSSLDVYSNIPAPGSAVETIFDDGFQFSSGVKFYDGSGALLVNNEVFKWRPAERGSAVEAKAKTQGILELGKEVWGMLDVVHPKPELLIVGTGRRTLLLSKEDRSTITEMGIRMDVMDTTHAASQYNCLSTERTPRVVAAALMADAFGA